MAAPDSAFSSAEAMMNASLHLSQMTVPLRVEVDSLALVWDRHEQLGKLRPSLGQV